MKIDFVVAMLISHFIADWCLQPPSMGRKKSEKLNVLLAHIIIIFLIPFLVGLFYTNIETSAILSALNAFTHFAIDGSIWKFYKLSVYLRNTNVPREKLEKEYKYWLDTVFGIFLGLDQILHVIFIYLIYSTYV